MSLWFLSSTGPMSVFRPGILLKFSSGPQPLRLLEIGGAPETKGTSIAPSTFFTVAAASSGLASVVFGINTFELEHNHSRPILLNALFGPCRRVRNNILKWTSTAAAGHSSGSMSQTSMAISVCGAFSLQTGRVDSRFHLQQ